MKRLAEICAVLVLAPAWSLSAAAQSTDIVAACNSEDVRARLSGCSTLLGMALPPQERALVHSRRSDAHLASGDFIAALADRLQAFELHPGNREYVTRLSTLYVVRSQAERDVRSRIASLNLAIKVDPSNPAAYFERAMVFLGDKDFEQATEDAKRAHELAPQIAQYGRVVVELSTIRATARLSRGEVDGAFADANAAVRLDPASIVALTQRARIHSASKRDAEALRDFAAALRLNSEAVDVYFARAEHQYTQGRYRDALDDLDNVVKRDGKLVEARGFRGLVYEALERKDDAIREYTAALEIEPANKIARASLERLKAPLPPASTTKPTKMPNLADLDDSERVTILQRELKRVGCDPGEIDGEWGGKTEAALTRYARKIGLNLPDDKAVETGIVSLVKQTSRVCDGEEAPAVSEQSGFEGVWIITWRGSGDRPCRRPGGYGSGSYTITIKNGAIGPGVPKGETPPASEAVGKVASTGAARWRTRATTDGAIVRNQGTFNGDVGSGSVARVDGKCTATFTAKRS